ncbi:tRNA lysidine(34) synthetase TilS [Alkalicaulis satelles]|uniref:tRNA lysidine(34) synthetase TilS n=1 Tax=Alkalicaulis satelles TaxID=2609175 RepID=UPI0018EA47F2|nr:tRNA lysidine(34) synthetase TilS [Alkalicaulis satelles]
MLGAADVNAPRLALGFSGGGDSTALLIALREGWPGIPVHALIVDHRLRPDSTREAALAAERARAMGAEPHILTWDQPRPGQGAARLARHRLMAQACRALGVKILCLGHTLDDRVETLRMRQARGGPEHTLTAMAPVSISPVWPEGRGLTIVRPLVGVWRGALRSALARRGAEWIEDPSNEDRRYERVRLRQTPLPVHEASALLERADDIQGFIPDMGEGDIELIEWSGQFSDTGWYQFRNGAMYETSRHVLPMIGQAMLAAMSGSPALAPLRASRPFFTALFNARAFTGYGVHLTASGALGRDPGAAGRADGVTAAPPVEVQAGQTLVFDGRYEITAKAPLTLSLLGARRPGLGEDGAPAVLRPSLILIEGQDGAELARADGPGRWLWRERLNNLMLSPALPAWFDARTMQARACAALAVTAARTNI